MYKVIKASYDDRPTNWEELDSKMVYDADGFTTDYTLYKQVDAEYYVCIFGDKDLYTPDNMEPDFETEIKDEAWDWFMEYESLEGEEYDY